MLPPKYITNYVSSFDQYRNLDILDPYLRRRHGLRKSNLQISSFPLSFNLLMNATRSKMMEDIIKNVNIMGAGGLRDAQTRVVVRLFEFSDLQAAADEREGQLAKNAVNSWRKNIVPKATS